MQVNIPLKQVIDNSYDITIDKLKKVHFDTKIAIVTNPKVAGLHLSYLLSKITAKELYIITVPDGEEYKNQDSINTILESLFNHRLNRKSMLIAFGGGVIGDMTGYAASIYQRGIDFIQIPTTLLSQVDSSKREFNAGMAEIIKMAVTFNKDFFEFLENADVSQIDTVKEIIKQAVSTKADVVAKDEKEHGIRAALNYGHTFGHVIEKETDYKTYLHGEAVSIGMIMANETSLKMGLMNQDETKRVENLLKKYNLPTKYKVNNSHDFYETFFLDKKSSDSRITFVLPLSIGGVKITDECDKDLILSILDTF